MNLKAIAVSVLVLAGVLALWLTRPEIEPQSSSRLDHLAPWEFPTAKHLIEDGIRIGPNSSDDIRVSREADSIRVEISADFLKKQKPEFLAVAGMVTPSQSMTSDRYLEFLEAIHMTVEHHGHDNGHGHDAEENHDHHDHDHDHDHDDGPSHHDHEGHNHAATSLESPGSGHAGENISPATN